MFTTTDTELCNDFDSHRSSVEFEFSLGFVNLMTDSSLITGDFRLPSGTLLFLVVNDADHMFWHLVSP